MNLQVNYKGLEKNFRLGNMSAGESRARRSIMTQIVLIKPYLLARNYLFWVNQIFFPKIM